MEIWLPSGAERLPAGDGPARWLGRADVIGAGLADVQAAVAEGFGFGGTDEMPVAALLRQHLAGDAGESVWLAADPAWIQPDMNGARLLACQQMQLSPGDAAALGRDLQPLFAEHEIELHVDDPEYWQLRLPEGLPAPALMPPSQAMGADVLAFVPAGAEGRRWRILCNEVQTLLHAHPLNAQRQASGLPPVNSLWFWGGGRLPPRMRSRWQGVISDDPVLLAAAAAAGLTAGEWVPATLEGLQGPWLVDLQTLDRESLHPWLAVLARLGRRHPLQWRLPDGRRWQQRPWHRWRFWRSAWTD
ncbi:hypothetical protein [Frateuria aurantia]|nr:hypothetical protein [Frateuria aurantia]